MKGLPEDPPCNLKNIKLDELDKRTRQELFSFLQSLDPHEFPEAANFIKGRYKTLYALSKIQKRLEEKRDKNEGDSEEAKRMIMKIKDFFSEVKQVPKGEKGERATSAQKRNPQGGFNTPISNIDTSDKAVRIVTNITELKQRLKELYEVEKKAFKDNPDIVLDFDEFKEMFQENSLVTVVEKNGKYVAFIVANPINEAGYELDSYDKTQIKKKVGEAEFRNMEEAAKEGKVYYIDDIASLDKNLTLKMLNDFKRQLEEKGVKYIATHARMKNKVSQLMLFYKRRGWKTLYKEVHEGHLGEEDFEFIIAKRNLGGVAGEGSSKETVDELRKEIQDMKGDFTTEMVSRIEKVASDLATRIDGDELTKLKMERALLELGKKAVEKGVDYGAILCILWVFPIVTELITSDERFNAFIELGKKAVEKGGDYGAILRAFPVVTELITSDERFNAFIELGKKAVEKGVDYWYILRFGFPAVKKLITSDERFNAFIELGKKAVEKGVDYWYILEFGFPAVKKLITSDERFNAFIELGKKAIDAKLDYNQILTIFTIYSDKFEPLLNYLSKASVKKLRELPVAMYPILMLRFDEKKDVLNNIKTPERRRAAMDKLVNAVIKEYNEFINELAEGKEVSKPELFEGLLLSLNLSIDKDPQGYFEKIKGVADYLHISAEGKTKREFYKEIEEKLKDFSAPIKVKPETRRYAFKFMAVNVELKVPEDVEKEFISVLKETHRDYIENGEELEKGIEKLKENFESIKERIKHEDIEKLAAELNIDKNFLEKYKAGKVPEENLLRMIIKRRDIDEGLLNYLVWKAINRSGHEEDFEKYLRGEVTPELRTLVFNTLLEFNTPLQDTLHDFKLEALEPAMSKSKLLEQMNYLKKQIKETKEKREAVSRDVVLFFTPKKTLLDVFQGVYSGTCFGDYPYDMIRKEVFVIKIFIDNEIKGAVLSIVRNIKGKDSLIIIGFDPSESFTSGLSTEKKHEFIDEVMKRIKDFAEKNDLSLYISDKAGGISNRKGFSEYLHANYFGKEEINVEPPTQFHPTFKYKVRTAVNLK